MLKVMNVLLILLAVGFGMVACSSKSESNWELCKVDVHLAVDDELSRGERYQLIFYAIEALAESLGSDAEIELLSIVSFGDMGGSTSIFAASCNEYSDELVSVREAAVAFLGRENFSSDHLAIVTQAVAPDLIESTLRVFSEGLREDVSAECLVRIRLTPPSSIGLESDPWQGLARDYLAEVIENAPKVGIWFNDFLVNGDEAVVALASHCEYRVEAVSFLLDNWLKFYGEEWFSGTGGEPSTIISIDNVSESDLHFIRVRR